MRKLNFILTKKSLEEPYENHCHVHSMTTEYSYSHEYGNHCLYLNHQDLHCSVVNHLFYWLMTVCISLHFSLNGSPLLNHFIRELQTRTLSDAHTGS